MKVGLLDYLPSPWKQGVSGAAIALILSAVGEFGRTTWNWNLPPLQASAPIGMSAAFMATVWVATSRDPVEEETLELQPRSIAAAPPPMPTPQVELAAGINAVMGYIADAPPEEGKRLIGQLGAVAACYAWIIEAGVSPQKAATTPGLNGMETWQTIAESTAEFQSEEDLSSAIQEDDQNSTGTGSASGFSAFNLPVGRVDRTSTFDDDDPSKSDAWQEIEEVVRSPSSNGGSSKRFSRFN